MKRMFGTIEVIFDILYLTFALSIGIFLILSANGNTIRLLAGLMALVLSGGDAFHLIPRILVIKTGNEALYQRMLGRGKQITSITMTLFYILLWHIGKSIFALDSNEMDSYLLYLLAFIRICLCILPQNKWVDRYPPVLWGIYRNIPFFLIGIMVGGLFFINRNSASAFELAWLAIGLSFTFYLPVVLWANQNPKIGMLMLPKTLAYVWLLIMCLSL